MSIEDAIQRFHKKLRIRNELIRVVLAEFLGTFVLVTLGVGVNAQGTFLASTTPISGALGWGLAVAFGIYVSVGVSGGHINPAVSLAMFTIGRLSFLKLILYMLAQYFGAFLASACVYGVYWEALINYDNGAKLTSGGNSTAGIWATYPQSFISSGTGLGDQIFSTMFFLIFIMAICDAKNANVPTALGPLLIGLSITTLATAFGFNCGGAMNPARDLGPRLFTLVAGWGNEVFSAGSYFFWIPIVGPHLGGILGVHIYLLLVGIHLPEKREEEPETERKQHELGLI